MPILLMSPPVVDGRMSEPPEGLTVYDLEARLEAIEKWKKSPITDDPAEWEDHSDDHGMWQNWKNSSAFSYDEGKTYFLLTDNVDPQKAKIYTSKHKE